MSAHKAAKHMGGNGDKGGDLILIGSMSAHSLGASSSIYAGMKKGIQGFAEALRKELGNKGIKVGLVEPGLTGADFQLPEIPVEKQREMINAEKMLRAEDIAVAVHFMLTQPRRAVVQQLSVTQRVSDE
jgi:NADP-dependent 3-hydroxy acid dehydrogenase YdfG